MTNTNPTAREALVSLADDIIELFQPFVEMGGSVDSILKIIDSRIDALPVKDARDARIEALTQQLQAEMYNHKTVRDEFRKFKNEWLEANGPGGWIDDMRERCKAHASQEPRLPPGLAHLVNATTEWEDGKPKRITIDGVAFVPEASSVVDENYEIKRRLLWQDLDRVFSDTGGVTATSAWRLARACAALLLLDKKKLDEDDHGS